MNKEKEFINIINKILNKDLKKDFVVGIGDDAAILTSNGTNKMAICSDTIVEDIHFKLDYFSFEDIGWKSIAINSSDLAAMGAVPNYFTVSIGLPSHINKNNFEQLIIGMKKCCDSYGGFIVGGDIVKSDKLFLSISAVGSLHQKKFLTRDSAKPGDKVAVTGNLGDSLGGLNLLLNNKKGGRLINSHLKPEPKIIESKKLIESGVKCCMDISDGLHNDLLNLCESSKVSIEINIEDLPVSKELKSEFSDRFIDIAINGGEDYELLFTFDESKIKLPFNYFVIGSVVNKNENNVLYKDKGKIIKPKLNTWSHFEQN